jgi:AraC family transcriptional regulator
MMLLRSFPDVADVPANRAFRRYFYSRWGKENSVISARASKVEYPPFTQRLSIKAAWGGRERYFIDGRTVAVDDDNYLVINDNRTYASHLREDAPVHSFSVFFRPGLAEETLAALETTGERWLDDGAEPLARPVEFAECLRPHDRLVSPLLRYIASQADQGLDDELWYEEQCSFLVERMLRAHCQAYAAIRPLELAREATRREILKRIGWSTDYIHTFYMRPLTMPDLAKSASLSRFHFIRLFRAVHGVTPFAFLQRRRAAVARRLLAEAKLGQAEIAVRTGFGSRSTMLRQLRRLVAAAAGSRHRNAAATENRD